MEYTLKLTVSPTVHDQTMAARLFISGRDDDGHRESTQVWECSVIAHPNPDVLEPLVWLDDLIGQVEVMVRRARLTLIMDPSETTMSDLFTHQRT